MFLVIDHESTATRDRTGTCHTAASLRHNVVNNFALYVGQPKISASPAIG